MAFGKAEVHKQSVENLEASMDARSSTDYMPTRAE
jgi:hypothetical protein